ncbi:MAG: hypothetical protein JXA13_13605 [Anaerolineales bacterium]|nr:hypothetical protein [Anaerolineales bacterium]
MIEKIKAQFSREIPLWLYPLFFGFLTAITFGWFVKDVGYYWDDWAFAWSRSHLGYEGMLGAFGPTRPIRASIDTFLTWVLGLQPLTWQVYSLLLRWLAAVAMWRLLVNLWPSRKHLAVTAVLLFIIYPGFLQQSLAMTYNYAWLFEGLLFLSFILMVVSIRNPHHFWISMIAAVLISGFHMVGLEYFFGLELLRPLLIWIVLSEMIPELKKRFIRTLVHYLPYLVVLGFYLYWRFFVFENSRYAPVLISEEQNIFMTILAFLEANVSAMLEAGMLTWGKILRQPDPASHSLVYNLIYGFSILAGFLLAAGLVYRLSRDDNAGQKYAWNWIGLGILSLFLAGLPWIVAGFNISSTSVHADRLMLPFIFGTSLLVAGLSALIADRGQRALVIGILVSLSIGFHFLNTDQYRSNWNAQKMLLWELTWRAPAVQPHTAFLSDDALSLGFNDDEALTYLVNWVYEPDNYSKDISYALIDISDRIKYNFEALDPGLPIVKDYHPALFVGTTDRVLVILYAPPSCLRILDPVYDQDLVFVRTIEDSSGRREMLDVRLMPGYTREALPLSNPDLILSDSDDPAQPPVMFFGEEPQHRWCYYFQKSDLARQVGDWEKSAELGDTAFEAGFVPDDISEYLLFIEAYARVGRWKDARLLTRKVMEVDPVLAPALCSLWQRVESDPSLGETESVLAAAGREEVKSCPSP